MFFRVSKKKKNKGGNVLYTGRYTKFLDLLSTLVLFRILLRKFTLLIVNVAKLLNKNKLDKKVQEFCPVSMPSMGTWPRSLLISITH